MANKVTTKLGEVGTSVCSRYLSLFTPARINSFESNLKKLQNEAQALKLGDTQVVVKAGVPILEGDDTYSLMITFPNEKPVGSRVYGRVEILTDRIFYELLDDTDSERIASFTSLKDFVAGVKKKGGAIK